MKKPCNLPSATVSSVFTNSLCDQLPGIYYQMDARTLSLKTCSLGSLPLLGYQPSEIIPENNFQQLVHPDDAGRFNTKTSIGPGLFTLEYRLSNRQGEYTWIRDHYVSTLLSNGEYILEGHLTGIEDSRLKWQLLHQLKAYRDAIDINIISSITDVDGTIIYVNKNFCRISQYTEQELLGQNHRIVCSGFHDKEFFRNLWKIIVEGKVWQGEILNRAKDGSLYWVDTVIIPVSDERNHISHYLSLRTLINGRKEAEKQKDEYIHLLEEIAFIVAHRIRGPLCSISGLVNLLQHQQIIMETDSAAISYLRASVDELDVMTHELSDLLYSHELDLRRKDYQDKIAKQKQQDQ